MLMTNINEINIGTVQDVNPTLTTALGEKAVVGMYRDTKEYVPKLAEFYLTANSWRDDKLLNFEYYDRRRQDPDSFMFVIAIGGDGAPISGTSFLISFLNVGERLMSSDENWLLFGTDENECCS